MSNPVVISVSEAGRITTVGGRMARDIPAEDLDALFRMLRSGDLNAVLVADRTPTGELPLDVESMEARI